MEQADLIWHNGELVAWEDAKVHVLTHGLHYGTGVFEGIRAYETPRRNRDLPPPRPPRAAVQVGRAVLHADPVHARGAALGDARADRVQRAARVLHPPDRVPRLRPDGPVPARRPGRGVDRGVAVGCVPRRGEQARRHPREDRQLAADLPRLADPARQGLRPVPEQRAGEDRGVEGRATRSRSCSTITASCARARARTSTSSASGKIVTPPHTAGILDGISRKSVNQIARDLGHEVVERDIARAELYLADEVFLCGHGRRAGPGPRDRRPHDRHRASAVR